MDLATSMHAGRSSRKHPDAKKAPPKRDLLPLSYQGEPKRVTPYRIEPHLTEPDLARLSTASRTYLVEAADASGLDISDRLFVEANRSVEPLPLLDEHR